MLIMVSWAVSGPTDVAVHAPCAILRIELMLVRTTAVLLAVAGTMSVTRAGHAMAFGFAGGLIGLKGAWRGGASHPCHLSATCRTQMHPFGQHHGSKRFYRASSVARWNGASTIGFKCITSGA